MPKGIDKDKEPKEYTKQHAIQVLNEFAVNDLSYRRTCTQLNYNYSEVWRIISRDFKHNEEAKGLYSQYIDASACKADLLSDSTLDIAEDTELSPAHAKNSIQARQKLATAYNRKRYGDKVESTFNLPEIQLFVPNFKKDTPSIECNQVLPEETQCKDS